ncbi:hypothetical protein QSV08_07715 [Maribacter sp. BPC-D8]|uniref:NADase-type glycan-binding domain-containing protein n=1 Tax=Maribacter sp. BPC-D8 TaxID=3053613 RepID=UPI002B46BD13|nr:hypothetical protein [Maribacter sp. BPC-D8]WRI31131.1 hypothetical protein QSV08_07715 [Maribacter sp. BPC-D8]
MRNAINIIFVSIIISLALACKAQKISSANTTVLAKIDSVSVYELSENSENKELFWLYANFDISDPIIFSRKFNGPFDYTDFNYSEALNFDFIVEPYNSKSKYLSDDSFKTYFSFNMYEEDIKIIVKLNKTARLEVFPDSNVDDILSVNDTLLNPLRFSLVNGNVTSKQAFKDFGRVKDLEVFINDESKGLVTLLDTPYIQEFQIAGFFKRDDTVILKPLNFYKGEKYDLVCISEMKKCLNIVIHSSIDQKYDYNDVLEKISISREKQKKNKK